MIRKIFALIPVCALAVACGGEQTPEPATPEGAAATEETPAEGGAVAPAEGTDTAAPADAADPAAAPAEGTTAPAEGSTAPAGDAQ